MDRQANQADRQTFNLCIYSIDVNRIFYSNLDLSISRCEIESCQPTIFGICRRPDCDCEWLTSARQPRVLFVYSTVNKDHAQMCRAMFIAVREKSGGINATSHEFEENAVARGISQWASTHIKHADYIIYICSKELYEIFNNQPNDLAGDHHSQELRTLCHCIQCLLWNPREFERKCIPVMFQMNDKVDYSPHIMRVMKFYHWPKDKEQLIKRISRVYPNELLDTCSVDTADEFAV